MAIGRSWSPRLWILKQIRRLFISTLVVWENACKLPLVTYFDHKQVEDAATNGNGRMARNTLEKAILNQSKRLVADPDASLELLLPGDFELE